MPLLAQIAETGSDGLSAAQALGDEARVVALAGLMAGLVLWLVGGRVLRISFGVLGTALGAFLGLVLLPLTGMSPIETGWQVFSTISPEQLGLMAGGILGLVLSVSLYRAAMALGAGLVFAGVGALGGLIFISHAPPKDAATPDGVDPAYMETIEDTAAEGEMPTLEDLVTTTALDEARAWTESRGQEAIDESLSGAERAGFNVREARAQLADAAERSSVFISRVSRAAQNQWERLEVGQRLVLLCSVLAGLAAGMLFGLVAPQRSAALISAMGGSAIVIGCGLMLADSYALPSDSLLRQPAPTWAIVWGVASALGLTFQLGEFWRDVYVCRPDERSRFESFISAPHCNLLIVTGGVGTGKSTFLFDKFEASVCEREILSALRAQRFEGPEQEHEAFERAALELTREERHRKTCEGLCLEYPVSRGAAYLDEFLLMSVRRRLVDHFGTVDDLRAFPEDDRGLLSRTDLEHHLEVEIPPKGEGVRDESRPRLGSRGERDPHLAACIMIAMVRYDPSVSSDLVPECVRERLNRFSRARLQDWTLEEFLELASAYAEHPEHCRRIISQACVVKWLHAYITFFRGEVSVLAIDNLDQWWCKADQQTFLERLCKILEEISERESARQSVLGGKRILKFAIASRETNIRSGVRPNGASTPIEQINLGPTAKSTDEPIDEHSLRLAEQTISSIIERRLAHLTLRNDIDHGVVRDFELLVDHMWNDGAITGEGGVPVDGREVSAVTRPRRHPKPEDSLSRFIRDLNNESIRLILATATNSTLTVLRSLHTSGRSVGEYIDESHAAQFRSLAIRCLLKEALGGSDAVKRMRGWWLANASKESSGCQPHRIVLTYLANKSTDSRTKSDRTVSVAQLARDLGRDFGYSESTIRDVLCTLFISERYQGSFISIYQESFIKTPGDIDLKRVEGSPDNAPDYTSSASVVIKPRGVCMLERVLISIDYWISLAYSNPQTPNLYETTPEEALHILDRVQDTFKNKLSHHEKQWVEMISNQRHLSGKDVPFDWYQELYCFTHAFYLRRVADAMKTVIEDYLCLTISRRTSEFGLSGESRTQVLSAIENTQYNAVKSLLANATGLDPDRRGMRKTTVAMLKLAEFFIQEATRLHRLQGMTKESILNMERYS
eukprot:g5580.t1